ncbi:MAG: four helix bundle protein [Anaerolineales bacterium]|nr:four helix bundle protein [Anaerolineales bacterium]
MFGKKNGTRVLSVLVVSNQLSTEYQLILAHDLEFISEESYEKLHSDVEEVKRMLASLLKTIRADR